MLRKLSRILGFLIGCGVVCVYIFYASRLAQRHRAEQRVTNVIISMIDSTETRQFASSAQIAAQLKRRGLDMNGVLVDSVNAVKLANYIADKGFVSDANVYVTYSGELHINIKQHKPVMRLLCGGLNSYITSEGDVFRSPQGAAYYTAVVTGGYRPMFVPKNDGDVESEYALLKAKEDARLTKLGEEFSSLMKERRGCREEISQLKDDAKRRVFESKKSHKQREVAIKLDIEKCNERLAQIDARRMQLEQRQRGIELRKKKLQKKYDDFRNLINFVGEISNDSFWRAEVVQFIADTTSTGEIMLRLVPRSGDFIITLGTLDERDEKMKKLQTFYDKGLSRLGWDRFKRVDLRYDKQVICAAEAE